MDLSNVKRVKLTDWSQYDSRTSRNGGGYWFSTEFDREEDGRWSIAYYTSAEFFYCSCCGCFNSKGYCDCDGEYEVISEEELMKRISSFEADDDHTIDFFYNE